MNDYNIDIAIIAYCGLLLVFVSYYFSQYIESTKRARFTFFVFTCALVLFMYQVVNTKAQREIRQAKEKAQIEVCEKFVCLEVPAEVRK